MDAQLVHMRCVVVTALVLSVPRRNCPARMTAEFASGYPISPELGRCVLLRYFYDGGTLKQARLVQLTPIDTDAVGGLTPADADAVSGLALLHALHDDGVDLESFYPCVRETGLSGGGWLRFLRGVVGEPPAEVEGGDVSFPLARGATDGSQVARRIDLKLFRRERPSADEVHAAHAPTVPCTVACTVPCTVPRSRCVPGSCHRHRAG